MSGARYTVTSPDGLAWQAPPLPAVEERGMLAVWRRGPIVETLYGGPRRWIAMDGRTPADPVAWAWLVRETEER